LVHSVELPSRIAPLINEQDLIKEVPKRFAAVYGQVHFKVHTVFTLSQKPLSWLRLLDENVVTI
jgi:hypothetical protein